MFSKFVALAATVAVAAATFDGDVREEQEFWSQGDLHQASHTKLGSLNQRTQGLSDGVPSIVAGVKLVQSNIGRINGMVQSVSNPCLFPLELLTLFVGHHRYFTLGQQYFHVVDRDHELSANVDSSAARTVQHWGCAHAPRHVCKHSSPQDWWSSDSTPFFLHQSCSSPTSVVTPSPPSRPPNTTCTYVLASRPRCQQWPSDA